MSHVYLFSHVCVFLYLLNYITSLYWKLSENHKHGCRNDQRKCKNKGRNESNQLSSNNLKFFWNNLGLVFHTTYSCIFHPCDRLLLFPLPHFQSPPCRRFCTVAYKTGGTKLGLMSQKRPSRARMEYDSFAVRIIIVVTRSQTRRSK